MASFAIFQDQLAARGVEPAVFKVQRLDTQEVVEITMPPKFFRTLGIQLDVGQIASIQQGSPAAAAGLQVGDKLAKINGRSVGLEIDPLKVPDEMARLHGEEVEIVYLRQNPTGGREELTVKLTPDGRPGWMEQPEVPGEPIAVPSIGIAMHIVPFVLLVDPEIVLHNSQPQPQSQIQLTNHPPSI